ncbi:MAG TPA: Gfo/Idh/MocA family oxidoreductase [Bacteroidales bacterium]|nr:Gfo/Idh/MocA family oxidoreductase [Bacteroidales bacterium]
MKKIKMGMIGGGPGAFIGDAHRRAARICNDYQLIGGVFSSDFSKTRMFAETEGLDLSRCYETVNAMIKNELLLAAKDRMEAIVIVTPNYLHFDAAKRFLEAGFHIICDKPVTITAEQAEELEKIVKATGLTFALTHTYTGYPMVRQMRSLIASGILGTIHRIDAQYYQGWMNPVIYGSPARIKDVWRLNPDKAGISSCMGDIGVHAFNLIEYTTGIEVKEVLSDLNNIKDEVKLDLDGTVMLRFGEKLKGVIRSSQVCGGEENGLLIGVYGSKGSIKWHQENPNKLYLLSENEPLKIYKPGHTFNESPAENAHTMPAGHPEGIYEAFANIYKGAAKSIRGERTEPGEFPTIHDGVRGMRFIQAVIRSNAEGNRWLRV